MNNVSLVISLLTAMLASEASANSSLVKSPTAQTQTQTREVNLSANMDDEKLQIRIEARRNMGRELSHE